ncbi:endopeptidase La [Bradyrhizobium lablabi]|uniref:Endopeptidase La n=1 Tax=Bradyrhizobium lablabi TaxID=722472 RepID=A0A0R3N4W0_9BRAD|nr:LON peptidase substrate-binding domain-containing protein [Bradyrhizobium lablabi]KRR27098.1 endopeptidase La [Bradyrhizobium lablabi]
MRDFRDAKAMAQTLREALKAKSVSLTHSESLELVAKTLGFPDWNFLAAKIQHSQRTPALSVTPAPGSASMPAGTVVPIVPMRDLVLFPQMIVPIFVGRDKTKRAIERALATDRRILVLTQRRSGDDDPALDALYSVGVSADVIICVTLADETLKLMVSGLERVSVVRGAGEEFLAAEIAPCEESRGRTAEAVALSGAVVDAYRVYANLDYAALPKPLQARLRLPGIDDPGMVADSVAPLLSAGIDQRQQLLETCDVVTRLEKILELLKTDQQAA